MVRECGGAPICKAIHPYAAFLSYLSAAGGTVSHQQHEYEFPSSLSYNSSVNPTCFLGRKKVTVHEPEPQPII